MTPPFRTAPVVRRGCLCSCRSEWSLVCVFGRRPGMGGASHHVTRCAHSRGGGGGVGGAGECGVSTPRRVHGTTCYACYVTLYARHHVRRSTNTSVMNTFTLDLHGQHVDEALASLERWEPLGPSRGSGCQACGAFSRPLCSTQSAPAAACLLGGGASRRARDAVPGTASQTWVAASCPASGRQCPSTPLPLCSPVCCFKRPPFPACFVSRQVLAHPWGAGSPWRGAAAGHHRRGAPQVGAAPGLQAERCCTRGWAGRHTGEPGGRPALHRRAGTAAGWQRDAPSQRIPVPGACGKQRPVLHVW